MFRININYYSKQKYQYTMKCISIQYPFVYIYCLIESGITHESWTEVSERDVNPVAECGIKCHGSACIRACHGGEIEGEEKREKFIIVNSGALRNKDLTGTYCVYPYDVKLKSHYLPQNS